MLPQTILPVLLPTKSKIHAQQLSFSGNGQPTILNFSSFRANSRLQLPVRPNDRAVTKAHDIGIRMVRNDTDQPGYEIIVGGGLGRSPCIGKVLREFLPKAELLPYIEAVVQRLQSRRTPRQQIQSADQDIGS